MALAFNGVTPHVSILNYKQSPPPFRSGTDCHRSLPDEVSVHGVKELNYKPRDNFLITTCVIHSGSWLPAPNRADFPLPLVSLKPPLSDGSTA
ncbi:hypothetical protein AVEN_37747-1 [Araneus ventricosus]|uniref:Uncharacterized protein n=1 Tax=Araneus ventricosus TaxID=182803 RepID=A0A4Y2BUP7_ARAVE|nr:hypothetical protein AVEN_37747-1 [Araneus ventricosus]